MRPGPNKAAIPVPGALAGDSMNKRIILGFVVLSIVLGVGGYAQGQLPLKRYPRNDFQQEVIVPTATAAFHHNAVFARMLLQQR